MKLKGKENINCEPRPKGFNIFPEVLASSGKHTHSLRFREQKIKLSLFTGKVIVNLQNRKHILLAIINKISGVIG